MTTTLTQYAVFVRFVSPEQEVRIVLSAVSGAVARLHVEDRIADDFRNTPVSRMPIVDRVELAAEPGEMVA